MDITQFHQYLRDYLKYKEVKTKKTGGMLHLDCPSCGQKDGANVPPNQPFISCLACGVKLDLFDVIRMHEDDMMDKSDDECFSLLNEILDLKVITEKTKRDFLDICNAYEKFGFDLVPVAAGGKNPIEKDWPNKTHTNKEEWLEWLEQGLNIGVKTGNRSKITVIDIDCQKIPEILEPYLNKTLYQITQKGYHLFFKYNEMLPKTGIKELKIDIENDGGQVVLFPSIVKGQSRQMVNHEIVDMSLEVYQFLAAYIETPKKTISEQIKEEIATENFKIKPEDLKLINNGLDGCCNSSFVKIGGLFRKELNEQQTEFALNVLNDHLLEHPMDRKSVRAMVQSLSKYISFDEEDLASKVVSYLKLTDSAFKQEIETFVFGDRAKGENKQRIDKVLNYLMKEMKIVKQNREYKLVRDMKWETNLLTVTTPIQFKMPYLDEFVHLKQTSLVLMGGSNKRGKTTFAMNILKRLVDQGIKPYYIYTESDSGFDETALKLGMKEGDFEHCFEDDYDNIILKPDSIVIYDWLKPKDFARTDNVYGTMISKIKRSNSFMICFAQLRENGEFFASDQVGQFPSVLARYLHEEGGDGTRTKIQLDLIRRPKMHLRTFEIPCLYDWSTKLVKTVEEVQREKSK